MTAYPRPGDGRRFAGENAPVAVSLKNRSVLEMSDFSREEIRFLLDLSRDLKRAKYDGTEVPRLRGKNLCLIFEKTSTRTRCAFEVAAYDQGMGVTYLDPTGSQIGHKESIKDTARVLGADVRRDRVPRVPPGRRRGARRVCRRARLQRPDGRVASHPDAADL